MLSPSFFILYKCILLSLHLRSHKMHFNITNCVTTSNAKCILLRTLLCLVTPTHYISLYLASVLVVLFGVNTTGTAKVYVATLKRYDTPSGHLQRQCLTLPNKGDIFHLKTCQQQIREISYRGSGRKTSLFFKAAAAGDPKMESSSKEM